MNEVVQHIFKINKKMLDKIFNGYAKASKRNIKIIP